LVRQRLDRLIFGPGLSSLPPLRSLAAAPRQKTAWLKNQVEDIFSACIIRQLFAVEVMRRLPKNLAV
jgi:hypothetical protein